MPLVSRAWPGRGRVGARDYGEPAHMSNGKETVEPPRLVSLDPREALAGESHASRLKALYEIGRRMLEPSDPREVLTAVHDTVVAHLGPERACVLAVERDGSLRPLVTTALDLSGPPSGWALSQTVLKRVRDSGLALLATDVAQDPEFAEAGSVHRLGMRSVLCVPLGRSPVRGLIYLDSREGRGRSFQRDDLDFLTAVSVHASLVLGHADERSRTSEALQQSQERLRLLEDELLRHEIVGRSPKLLAAYDALRRFALAGARVVLRGETGTGKELFARAYAASSPRRGGPYVPVPIPALAPTLAESELFGHVRGAFTEAARDKKGRLELAGGGVLFLDEIGDVDLSLQVKLLRFLDSGELYRVGDTEARRVDALVVSATNRPLEKLASEGRFREDFLARLGHTVSIPPLRERPEDVPLLVEHLLACHDRGEPRKCFSSEAMELLQGYRWEFNVRQLQQVVERAICLVDGDVIGPEDLPDYIRKDPPQPHDGAYRDGITVATRSASGRPRSLRDVVRDLERAHIEQTLAHTNGNRRQATEILGVSSETFYKRLEEFGLGKKTD